MVVLTSWKSSWCCQFRSWLMMKHTAFPLVVTLQATPQRTSWEDLEAGERWPALWCLLPTFPLGHEENQQLCSVSEVWEPEKKKNPGQGVFFLSVGKFYNGRNRQRWVEKGRRRGRSTGKTGKFQFVLWQLWMWDWLRRCSNYLAGSFENSFLFGTERPAFSVAAWETEPNMSAEVKELGTAQV